MHPAALVNHVLPDSKLFGPNVVGTAELIRLALPHKMKHFLICPRWPWRLARAARCCTRTRTCALPYQPFAAKRSLRQRLRHATRAHYDGLPVDFTAASIVALGQSRTTGFHTLHVSHDDGVSMDQFVDWIAESGHPVQRRQLRRLARRFETALKALPEKQRQQSFLPLLHQLRTPMPATPGAAV